MNVLFLTSGLLPVPATKGGAIETLLDGLIEENEIKKKINITVITIKDRILPSKKKYTNYISFEQSIIFSLFTKIINKILKKEVLPKNFIFMRKAIKYINRNNNKYDFIIVENSPEIILKLKHDKIIEYVHSDVLNSSTKNAKKIINKCFKIFTVSDFIKNEIDKVDKSFCETFTILNFNTLKKIDIKTRKLLREKNRKKYHINKDTIVFSYLGRISPEKGTLELVKSFNDAAIPNSKLIIIGGIWYDSKNRNNYLSNIENISNSNVIFTGYVDHNDVSEILCASDVGIVPSMCNEAAGLSIIEFMNSGNYVIGANRGGIPEYLSDKYGCVVDINENDYNNLTNKLIEVSSLINEDVVKYNINYSNNFSVENYYENFIKNLK